MQAGLAESTMWLGGACLVRVALVPGLLSSEQTNLQKAHGDRERRGWPGSASAGSLGVQCHAEARAAPAGVRAFLPQEELGRVVHGDWAQGWPAGGDLQEGSFQLLTGTKPALKGSAAESVCPGQSVAPKQAGTV